MRGAGPFWTFFPSAERLCRLARVFMIKKLIDKLLGKTAPRSGKPRVGKRHEVPFDGHRIDPALVDERAVQVVHTLKAAGYEAYIVGGAVRDLILGLKPKDFDVATNATPEQVKALFRRAFIIGRRFRIVHVVFGRGRQERGLHEVIEVSTFRALLDGADATQVKGNERVAKAQLHDAKHAVDGSGRVLRDNVWGTQEEDAARRDFTVNAMYYDPESQLVVDYHGGIQDAQKRLLRMIGEPAVRYREDPVRIIRAVRFAAKLSGLGFKLERKTAAPILEARALLADVPQSRLFDEMLKLLQTGHALASVAQLRELGLQRGIYPLLDLVVERADDPFVQAALADTDRRVSEGRTVAPSFLLGCVLWGDVRDGWSQRRAAGQAPFPALSDAVAEVFEARIGDVSGRGKLGADMCDTWTMQPRFEKRIGSGPFSLVEQARFRAGLDFLRLRAQVGEASPELATWWDAFWHADQAGREGMVRAVRESTQAGPRRVPAEPRTRRVPKAGLSGDASNVSPASPDPGERDAALVGGVTPLDSGSAEPVKRRRRRRRKPGGGSAGDPGDAPPASSNPG